MELTVSQSLFSQEVSLAMAAVENKATLPTANLIHLEAKGESLIITSTNLEFGIRIKVPAKVEKEGVLILSASRLNNWLGHTPDGEVSIKVGKQAAFRLGKIVAHFSYASNATWPDFPSPGKVAASIPGDFLAKALNRVYPFIPNDDPRFRFSRLELKDGELATVAAVDGRMAATFENGGFEGQAGILLAKKVASDVSRFAAKAKGGIVRLYLDGNNVFFGFGDRQICSRSIGQPYPQWRKALPSEADQHIAKVDAKLAIQSLERAGALSDGNSRMASFEFSSNSIKVYIASDNGTANEDIECEYSGPDMTIGFDYSWVIDSLRAVGPGAAEIRITAPSRPAEIRPFGNASYRHMIAPMDIPFSRESAA